jgi:hypothetical protein
MIEVLLSIAALIAAGSVAYLLLTIDTIVNYQLYQFGLQFSYDWANPYWLFIRMSLALLGIVAATASFNIAFFFWKRLRKPKVLNAIQEEANVQQKEARVEEAAQDERAPLLFQCSSCGRSITHPLRLLEFHSQKPEMINVCPFCNAAVLPASYVNGKQKAAPAEGEEEEKIKKSN